MATKRRSAKESSGIVSAWKRSGLSRGEFARRAGVNPVTLGWWKWRLQAEPEPDLPAFVDVVVEDSPQRAPDFDLTVGEFSVRVPLGFDAFELQRLLAVLC